MGALTASSVVALTMLAAAACLTFIRLLKGPTLPDRVVAIDLIGVLMVCILVVTAAATGQQAFLDVAMVVALISFVGTVAYSRYIERIDHDGMAVRRRCSSPVQRWRCWRASASSECRTCSPGCRRRPRHRRSVSGCLLVGLRDTKPEFAFVVRAVSIAAFMLLTTAVGAHVIARAAALTGAPLWKGTIVDERPTRHSW